jgi:hypothetical protein
LKNPTNNKAEPPEKLRESLKIQIGIASASNPPHIFSETSQNKVTN